jgi:Flp pilus assembly pilin Flp
MLKTMFRFAHDDDGSTTVDWLVLATGVLSLVMAIVLTATNNANAESSLTETVVTAND